MDFDEWRIGNTYTPSELTQIIQDTMSNYKIGFMYNSRKAPKVQKGNINSEICSLEKFVEEKFTSLEMEFISRSTSDEENMIYLWLKFSLAEEYYKLNSSIKSKSNQNYLRQKPQVWGAEEAEADPVE